MNLKQILCNHKDKEEVSRYYTGSYSYKYCVYVYKIYKCKNCGKIKKEKTLENKYNSAKTAIEEMNRLKYFNYSLVYNSDEYITNK
jgi:hypothetical protein